MSRRPMRRGPGICLYGRTHLEEGGRWTPALLLPIDLL